MGIGVRSSHEVSVQVCVLGSRSRSDLKVLVKVKVGLEVVGHKLRVRSQGQVSRVFRSQGWVSGVGVGSWVRIRGLG